MSVFETRYQLQRDTRFLYLIFTLLLILIIESIIHSSQRLQLLLVPLHHTLILDKNWQETLKQTLDDFQRVPLKDRENIIEALLFFVKLDQQITPSEYDVIRLISYRMGIPLSLDLKLVERD